MEPWPQVYRFLPKTISINFTKIVSPDHDDLDFFLPVNNSLIAYPELRYAKIYTIRLVKSLFKPTFRRLKQGQGSFLVRINKFELFVNKDKTHIPQVVQEIK